MEEARVVVQHMELSLLNVACDDPGITVGAQLVLPVLQERLDARAQVCPLDPPVLLPGNQLRIYLGSFPNQHGGHTLFPVQEFAAERAKMAESEIIRMLVSSRTELIRTKRTDVVNTASSTRLSNPCCMLIRQDT
jgi:hypothetical protein